MANALYDKGRQGFLEGAIDWDTDSIKLVLIDTADYTVDLANHDNLDDIPAAARVATSGNLASKTVTDGVADAADVTFTSVSGDTVEAIALYKDTGNESTSRLIAYIDTATGLPLTPNGEIDRTKLPPPKQTQEARMMLERKRAMCLSSNSCASGKKCCARALGPLTISSTWEATPSRPFA